MAANALEPDEEEEEAAPAVKAKVAPPAPKAEVKVKKESVPAPEANKEEKKAAPAPVAKIEEKKAASAPAPVAPVAKQEEMKKAAPVSISHDEDLMLTLQVIMDHANRSSTASKEQLIHHHEESKKEMVIEAIDVSIPYMATAKLAFEHSDKSMSYDEFEIKYLADSVLDVISKRR